MATRLEFIDGARKQKNSLSPDNIMALRIRSIARLHRGCLYSSFFVLNDPKGLICFQINFLFR